MAHTVCIFLSVVNKMSVKQFGNLWISHQQNLNVLAFYASEFSPLEKQTAWSDPRSLCEHSHTLAGTRPLIHLSCTHNKTTSKTPWPFNYSSSHLVHHDLPRGNCICRLFFHFVFCSTFATNAANLSWPSAPLWSYRAFTYKPFPGLIALQYNLHLYSPLHTNMIWRLCPW